MEDEKKPAGVELTIDGKRREVVGPVTITVEGVTGFDLDPALIERLRSEPLTAAVRAPISGRELCEAMIEAADAEGIAPALAPWSELPGPTQRVYRRVAAKINGGDPLVESVATGGAAETLVVGPDNGGGGVDLSGDPTEGPWGAMGPLGERFYGPKVLRDILEGALLFACHERYEGRLLESLRRAVESGLLPGVEVREVPQGASGRRALTVYAVAGTWDHVLRPVGSGEPKPAAFRTECMESWLHAVQCEAERERGEIERERDELQTRLRLAEERVDPLVRAAESKGRLSVQRGDRIDALEGALAKVYAAGPEDENAPVLDGDHLGAVRMLANDALAPFAEKLAESWKRIEAALRTVLLAARDDLDLDEDDDAVRYALDAVIANGGRELADYVLSLRQPPETSLDRVRGEVTESNTGLLVTALSYAAATLNRDPSDPKWAHEAHEAERALRQALGRGDVPPMDLELASWVDEFTQACRFARTKFASELGDFVPKAKYSALELVLNGATSKLGEIREALRIRADADYDLAAAVRGVLEKLAEERKNVEALRAEVKRAQTQVAESTRQADAAIQRAERAARDAKHEDARTRRGSVSFADTWGVRTFRAEIEGILRAYSEPGTWKQLAADLDAIAADDEAAAFAAAERIGARIAALRETVLHDARKLATLEGDAVRSREREKEARGEARKERARADAAEALARKAQDDAIAQAKRADRMEAAYRELVAATPLVRAGRALLDAARGRR